MVSTYHRRSEAISPDTRVKSIVDVLLKEFEISRREVADATNRNFDSGKFLLIAMLGTIGSMLIYIDKMSGDSVIGRVVAPVSIVFALSFAIYFLISTSMYAFIIARTSYEQRIIRSKLVNLLGEKYLLYWDIDDENYFKGPWLRSGNIVSSIVIFIIFLSQFASSYIVLDVYKNNYVFVGVSFLFIAIDLISIFYLYAVFGNLKYISLPYRHHLKASEEG